MGMVRGEAGSGTYRPLSPQYWTRKELYNRVRWLRGKITRLIMEGGSKEELEKRQAQLRKYQKVRFDREHQLNEMARQKHNHKRRRKRARAKAKAKKALVDAWFDKRKNKKRAETVG
jgi:hypothetical protein